MIKYSCDRCRVEAEKMNHAYITEQNVHLCNQCYSQWQKMIDNLQRRMHDDQIRLGQQFMRIDPPVHADETVIVPKSSSSEYDGGDISIKTSADDLVIPKMLGSDDHELEHFSRQQLDELRRS